MVTYEIRSSYCEVHEKNQQNIINKIDEQIKASQ